MKALTGTELLGHCVGHGLAGNDKTRLLMARGRRISSFLLPSKGVGNLRVGGMVESLITECHVLLIGLTALTAFCFAFTVTRLILARIDVYQQL